VIVKGFIKCCITDETDGKKDKVGNADSEHESVSSECETEEGNWEDSEAETDNLNGEQ
jgi:hypothetical protein